MVSKKKAYGLTQPFIDIFPEPVFKEAAPTSSEKNFDIGQIWVYKNGNTRTAYMYGGLDSNGNGVWILAGPGASDVDTLSGDSGTATPSGGDITLAGGTNITTSASSSTVTFNMDAAISLATSVTSPLYTVDAATDLSIEGVGGQDVVVTLGGSAGSENFIVEADDGTVLWTVDSIGNITFSGLTVTGNFAQTGGTFDVGQDNAANAINIGGGNTARAISIGNGSGAHTLALGNGSAGAATWDSGAGISIDAATASNFTVTGASEDLTLSSVGGSVEISATEDAPNSISLTTNGGTSESIKLTASQGTGVGAIGLDATAGGVTIQAALASDDAINLAASAGGVDIDGAMQVNIASSENAADAIVINSSAGGIDVTAAGATGEDLDLTCTAGSVNITAGEAAADSVTIQSASGGLDVDTALQMNLASSENAADAIVMNASAGGIDITAAGAAGEDLDLTCTSGSVNITAGEDNAGAIYIHANGGTSERVRLHADQGTGADSVFLESDVGGITLSSGLASDDAINLSSSSGGVDIDGAMQVNIASSENAADAIVINSSAGGLDITAAGAAGEDIDITCTAGSLNITAGESASDAIVINASGAAGAIQLQSGTGGVVTNSGMTHNVTSVATGVSPYTVLGSDHVIAVDTSAGAVTLTLPASPATGRTIVVVDEAGNANAQNITISGNGNNIAAGGTLAGSKAVDSDYGTMTLYFTGTIWNGQDVA